MVLKNKKLKQIIKNLGYWEDITKEELEAHLKSRRRELLDLFLGSIKPKLKPKLEKELEQVENALKFLLEKRGDFKWGI